MIIHAPARRRLLVGVSATLLGVVIAGLAIATHSTDPNGPLRPREAVEVEFPLPVGTAATWGVTLPLNPTGSAIRVESVEPVTVEGLDVLGVVANEPTQPQIVNALGFPPDGMRVGPVEGSVLPAAAGSSPRELQMLIGVRLTEPSTGSIDDIRVIYRIDGSSFEVILPWTLTIEPAG